MCALCCTAFVVGCGGSDEEDDSIVAAFYPLAYAARNVAPETTVRDLTPPGAEPHDLELSARDVERLRDASLVVYAGEGFQPAVEEAVSGRSGPSLDVLDSVELLPGDGASDPHVWLDPLRYVVVARSLAHALGDPRDADRLVARLEELDRDFGDGLRRCKRRQIVTSHAAFAYLADRYDLEQVPLVGVSPEAEPSAGELERLVAQVRETGATTVFSEPLVSPRLAETVAREAGVQTATLNPIEALTPEEEERGADYFDLMRENLAALRDALGCT